MCPITILFSILSSPLFSFLFSSEKVNSFTLSPLFNKYALWFSIHLFPNVYSAANLEGANLTLGIILGINLNNLCKNIDFLLLEDALLDLIDNIFAPPNFAANKSNVDKECSLTLITYRYLLFFTILFMLRKDFIGLLDLGGIIYIFPPFSIISFS